MRRINIISWNVNGIKAIEKKKALSWIDEKKIDFLFLQETKVSLDKYDSSILFNKNFEISTNNPSKYSKGFSGTLSFSKYMPKSKSFCKEVDIENDGRVIEYRYEGLAIFNVYFPNGKLNKSRLLRKLNFYKEFFDYCNNLKNRGFSIIICGDFNTAYSDLDLKPGKIYSNAGFTEIEREHFEIFLNNGFVDSFRYINGNVSNAYTLFPYRSKAREKNEGWRIDYILISEDLKSKLRDAFILKDVLGSDHCPIGIEIDLSEYF